jgi:hypothetical protein
MTPNEIPVAVDEPLEEGDDFAPDCGAVTPEEECGECEACFEAEAQAIDRSVETGERTESEALEAHALHGTYRD